MRSVVGKKDVFLSYAHINVAFAQRIKVIVPRHLSLHTMFFSLERCVQRELCVCVM